MLPLLNPKHLIFPNTESALVEPNGLLAIGGDLSVPRLIAAYQLGIFPWFNEGEPILWWSPAPRMILIPNDFRINRSLRKALNRNSYTVTINHDFAAVINNCATVPRQGTRTTEAIDNDPSENEEKITTWITKSMYNAYCDLHDTGYAHSVELWQYGELVAGIYGVALGKIFFGESMFTHINDGSKIAFAHLIAHLRRYQYALVDCQVYTSHLSRLGAHEISRQTFENYLCNYINATINPQCWQAQRIYPSDFNFWVGSNCVNGMRIDKLCD